MTSEKAYQRPDRLHALTSLRFFAAMFVVCYHSLSAFMPWIVYPTLLGRIAGLGYVSVSFFFLLSGYILGVVYLRRGGPVRSWDFYKARFARVYPLFFLTLVLDTPTLFFARVGHYGMKSAAIKTAVTFLGNTFMLHAWFLQLRGIDNPNWSLSVETLFYLTFPFIGVLLWKLRGPTLWLVAALLYAGGQGVVFVAVKHVAGDITKFLPVLHLSTFALGILLARWQALGKEDGSRRQDSGIAPWLVSGLALAAFAVVVGVAPEGASPLLYDGLLAPIFAAVIWSFSHSEWLPARLMSQSWLVVLGEASFGLYLFHIPVFHLFEWRGWIHIPALFPVYIAVCVAVSVVSFYWFETPTRKWILRRGHTHVKETMEAASSAQ